MDYDRAIEHHRQPLLGVIASLYAMIGLAEGGLVERLPKRLYRKVLGLLRPAEAAVRRLILVMAQGLEVAPAAARQARKGKTATSKGKSRKKAKRRRLFLLFDPEERADAGIKRRKIVKVQRPEPRIRSTYDGPLVPWFLRPEPPGPLAPQPKPLSDGSVSAVSLCHRLFAVMDALMDMPGQAMRCARWRAKPVEERRPQLETALRHGPPPGLREKSRHEVHKILKECHCLACSLPEPDSS